MPPKLKESRVTVFVDGVYLSRKACVLICCDEIYVIGWYLCRYENSKAWTALMRCIATPKVVVSDGGSGFRKDKKERMALIFNAIRFMRIIRLKGI